MRLDNTIIQLLMWLRLAWIKRKRHVDPALRCATQSCVIPTDASKGGGLRTGALANHNCSGRNSTWSNEPHGSLRCAVFSKARKHATLSPA